MGDYHFHTEPLAAGCVYKATAGKHSPLFAVLIDSIPVYGPLGEQRRRTAPSHAHSC